MPFFILEVEKMNDQLKLNIDYSKPDNQVVKRMATEAVECGDFLNWDHAYESIWDVYEGELKCC
jgi:hypothetical protein